MKEVEFHYDFGSPNAFLVYRVLPRIAAKYGARIVLRPILLGGVFKAANNRSPMEAFAQVSGKLAYQRREIDRFVARHEIDFRFNPHFPVMTIGLMRGAVYAAGKPWETAYVETVFNATWRDGEKTDDAAVIARVLADAGLPAEEILAATARQEVKDALFAATAQAVERGVFGAPTMFIGDEMYFGKDSLVDLEYDLA